MLWRCALVCLLFGVPSRAQAEPGREAGTTAPGRERAPVAPAEPERAPAVDVAGEARRVHAEGLTLFNQGRYPEAIERFRAAHALLPAPGLLYNIAQAERLSGHCEAAVREYRRFLELTPDGRASELARENLRELEPCTAAGAVPPMASAEPSRAPRPTTRRATTPRPGAAPVPRTKPARTLPAPPERDSAGPKKSSKVLVASVSFGSAAALLALSGYFAWRADRASDHTTELFAHGGRWAEADAAVERDGQRSQAFALVGLASSAVAVGIGAWSLTFD